MQNVGGAGIVADSSCERGFAGRSTVATIAVMGRVWARQQESKLGAWGPHKPAMRSQHPDSCNVIAHPGVAQAKSGMALQDSSNRAMQIEEARRMVSVYSPHNPGASDLYHWIE